jgi:hypothetical protein
MMGAGEFLPCPMVVRVHGPMKSAIRASSSASRSIVRLFALLIYLIRSQPPLLDRRHRSRPAVSSACDEDGDRRLVERTFSDAA